MTKSSLAAFGRRKFGDHLQFAACHGLNHQLSDAVTAFDDCRIVRVQVDQQNLEFTPVPRVDEPGGVETCHTVSGSKAAAGLDKTGEALRDGYGNAGGHHGASTTRFESHGGCGPEVKSGVSGPGVGRELDVGVDPNDLQCDCSGWHHSRVFGHVHTLSLRHRVDAPAGSIALPGESPYHEGPRWMSMHGIPTQATTPSTGVQAMSATQGHVRPLRALIAVSLLVVALAFGGFGISAAAAQTYPPQPDVEVDKPIVPEGGVVIITGSGFSPNASITLTDQFGNVIGTTTTDANGNWTFEWNTTEIDPDDYFITASDGVNEVTFEIDVTPPGPVPPDPTIPPTTVAPDPTPEPTPGPTPTTPVVPAGPTLPQTGGVDQQLLRIGAIALAVGALMVLAVRNRRPSAAGS